MPFEALQKVFRNPRFSLLAIAVALMVFLFAVWFPNLGLIKSVLFDTSVSLESKIQLPLSLLGSIGTNFTSFSALYTIAIAILFGVYIAVLTYFLKYRIKEVGQSGIATGFLGITSGVLGVGCAACGSFLLTSLSLVGTSGVLAVLPLQGGEFGLLGVALLALAIYMVGKQIENRMVCKAEV